MDYCHNPQTAGSARTQGWERWGEEVEGEDGGGVELILVNPNS